MVKKFLCIFCFIILLISGCANNKDDNKDIIDPCANGHDYLEATCTLPKRCSRCGKTIGEPLGHEASGWIYPEGSKCMELVTAHKYCTRCHMIMDSQDFKKPHQIKETIIEPTCLKTGLLIEECTVCGKTHTTVLDKVDHKYQEVIDKKATINNPGIKHKECIYCGKALESFSYPGNGVSYHGKLSVNGPDLVDKRGEKVQLIGLSTHGLQWFGDVVNYDTFSNIKDEFGINLIRLALYTAEGGYCEASESKKNYFIDLITKGVNICKELDMYVIIDWHCVGADDVLDKNPLTYVNESVDFFSKMAERFASYDNVIFEIMNEPNGKTSWSDCKSYALQVIPAIRKYSDGVILVGNPKWTSDLQSVMNNPITGFDNLMYSYHFYANDIRSPFQVTNAYLNGFPVFISEHGGMDASGDGAINYSSVNNWYSTLDKYNISYCAWNISNSKGSASILKQNESFNDFSDSHLKEWGIFYKKITRKRFKLN